MTFIHDKTFPALQYIIADNIHSAHVSAIFTTRNGGISGMTPGTEHLYSLNLQLSSNEDTDANIKENYRIITASQGFGCDDVMQLWQKHSDNIIVVDEAAADSRPHGKVGEADALVTNVKGVLLSVRTADCVPLLLYDGVSGAIGAVHAGWRGTFSRIGTKTVQYMKTLYGTNPQHIQAAIGPATGACCFEVGTDVYERFKEKYGEAIDAFFFNEQGCKPYCDLKAMNKAFLMDAGVPEQNIALSEWCTKCNPALFFSHRRSGEKRGIMASFIGMKEWEQ